MEETTTERAITEATIRAEIARMEAARDDFIQQANREIASYNGGIIALRALLTPQDNDAA